MRYFKLLLALPLAIGVAACEGETTEVEQPVVTDAVDTGIDPIDTDQEAAPAVGGAAVGAPGTEADVGMVGPTDVPGNQVDAVDVNRNSY